EGKAGVDAPCLEVVEAGIIEPGGVDVLAIKGDAGSRHQPAAAVDAPRAGRCLPLVGITEELRQLPRPQRVGVGIGTVGRLLDIELAHVELAVEGGQVKAPNIGFGKVATEDQSPTFGTDAELADTVDKGRLLLWSGRVDDVGDGLDVVLSQ